jgi:hypothetical protein
LVLGPTSFPQTRLYEITYLPEVETLSSTIHIPADTTPPTSKGAISPAVITQLNILAKTNTRIAELLNLASTGLASLSDMRKLGTFVQSISAAPSAQSELVIEFAERPNIRYRVPKDTAFWSVESAPSDEENKGSEIWIRTVLAARQDQVGEPVTIRVREPSQAFVEFLSRWLDRADAPERVQHWQTLVI